MAYIAQFSPRYGTAASKMKDDILKAEKKHREKILTEILKKTALAANKRFIGKAVMVLPLAYENGYLIGKSWHYKTVKFKGDKGLIGQFVNVKINKATNFGLS
jgi:tRNA-2-methylthio-N6-dimethylallyladenosine synthase